MKTEENGKTSETLDYRPLTALLTKRDKLLKKHDELEEIGPTLEAELADLSKKMNPLDSKSSDTILMHKTRLEILPGRIAENDEEIARIEAEIEKEVQSMDEVLTHLFAVDHERLIFAASKSILPWCETEIEARFIAETLPRVVKFASMIKGAIYATGADKARRCLKLFERKCVKGTILPDDVLALLPPHVEIKN